MAENGEYIGHVFRVIHQDQTKHIFVLKDTDLIGQDSEGKKYGRFAPHGGVWVDKNNTHWISKPLADAALFDGETT